MYADKHSRSFVYIIRRVNIYIVLLYRLHEHKKSLYSFSFASHYDTPVISTKLNNDFKDNYFVLLT